MPEAKHFAYVEKKFSKLEINAIEKWILPNGKLDIDYGGAL